VRWRDPGKTEEHFGGHGEGGYILPSPGKTERGSHGGGWKQTGTSSFYEKKKTPFRPEKRGVADVQNRKKTYETCKKQGEEGYVCEDEKGVMQNAPCFTEFTKAGRTKEAARNLEKSCS